MFIQVITLALVLLFISLFSLTASRSKTKAAFSFIMAALSLSILPAACGAYVPGLRSLMVTLFIAVLACGYCFSVLMLLALYRQKKQKNNKTEGLGDV